MTHHQSSTSITMLACAVTVALLLGAQPIASASSSTRENNGVPLRRRTITNTKGSESVQPSKRHQQHNIISARNLVAPMNDACTKAINIPATSSLPHSFSASYTTVGATSDFATESCGAASETNGVWYKYTPSVNETLTSTVVDTNADADAESYANYATASGLGIRVYAGSDCSSLTCVSEFDPSSITLLGEANVEYKFLISSAASSSGAYFSFALDIEESSANDVPTISPSKSIGGMDVPEPVPTPVAPTPVSTTGTLKDYSLYRDDHNSTEDEEAPEMMESYMSYSTKSSKYTTTSSSSSSSDEIDEDGEEDDCAESMSMSMPSKSSKTSAKAFKSKAPKRGYGYDSSMMLYDNMSYATTTKTSTSTSSSSSKGTSASMSTSMKTSSSKGSGKSSSMSMSMSKSSKTTSKCGKIAGKTGKSKSSKMGKTSRDGGNDILGLNALNRLNTLSNDGVVMGTRFSTVFGIVMGWIVVGLGAYHLC